MSLRRLVSFFFYISQSAIPHKEPVLKVGGAFLLLRDDIL